MIEETIEQLISKVKSTQQQISALLDSVADEQDLLPDSGEWSFRYIAAHLATVDEECYLYRVEHIAAGEKPFFESYFNTGRDFSQYDLRESLHQWADTRQKMIDYVHLLPEESLSLTGTHEAFGTITILDVFRMMLDHDREHLQHLEQSIHRIKAKTPPDL